MPATMSTTWTLTDKSTVVVNASIPDAAAAQIVAWLMATLPQQNDASGVAIPRTPQALIKQWEEGQMADAAAQASAWASEQAAKAAAAAVVPIAPTIS